MRKLVRCEIFLDHPFSFDTATYRFSAWADGKPSGNFRGKKNDAVNNHVKNFKYSDTLKYRTSNWKRTFLSYMFAT